MNTPTLQQIRNKLDRAAIKQLRAEVIKLHLQLEETQKELAYALDDADFWQQHAGLLRGNDSAQIGLTKNGTLINLQSNG